VQGENLALVSEREAAGHPFPDVVKYADGVWHCLHPEFLADQVGRSLGRLQLATLDVALLHNPEYFLKDAHERSAGPLEKRREEFYRRIAEAFKFLEGEVAAGRIGAYGVSSNTCTSPASDPEFTSLTRFVEIAREVGGADHHFRVLQLAMNLLEPGAVLERNNGRDEGETVLETARREGIAVLANRPLNATVGEGLLRLSLPPEMKAEVDFEMQRQRLAELEDEYRESFAPYIRLSDERVRAEDLFRWSEDMGDLPARVEGLEHWEAIEHQRILPQLFGIVRALDQAMEGPIVDAWMGWRDRYLSELQRLLGEVRRRAADKTRERVSAVTAAVDPYLPAERRGESLSRKALWVAASTPGVSCVLNGMRRVKYVDDALGILPWPALPDAVNLYKALNGLRV
jgi:uncharacterized protein